jgi:uncharacterized Ntn-hydrolase superfamily protein
MVTWAEPGVGVVATQAFVEVSYGPLGLALIKGGKTPREALKSLLATDPNPAVRQVAMLDSRGRVAMHTGGRCTPHAGHATGKGFSAQANLMRNRRVWGAMASAFRRSRGDLTSRLLAALDAAEAAGGDIRGRQSAAILVVRTKPTGAPWRDKILDLRVEDNPEPLKELRRLVVLHQAYEHENKGDELMAKGKLTEAIEQYRLAAQHAPKNEELIFWEAVGLANNGRVPEAKKILKRVFKKNRDWKEVLSRLPRSGILRLEKDAMRDLLS